MHVIPSFSLYFMFLALRRYQGAESRKARRPQDSHSLLYEKEGKEILVMIFFTFAKKKQSSNHHRQSFRRNGGQPNSI